MKTFLASIALPAAVLSVVSPVGAAEESPFSLRIGGGIEYDDNITVDETDVTTNLSDESLVIDGGVAFRTGSEKSVKLEVGYDFYQTLHEDLTAFDIQMHGLYGRLAKTIGGADAALDYRYTNISLGGAGLIEMHSVRPNVGFLVGTKFYALLSYEYQDRDNKLTNARDADQHAGSVGGIVLFGEGRTLNLAYKLVRENAIGPEFDYWGHVGDIGFKTPLMSGDWQPVWRIQYRYTHRDYSNVTPAIAIERKDRRHLARTSLTLPIFDSLSFRAQYEYIDANSNLAAVDYSDHIASGVFTWEM